MLCVVFEKGFKQKKSKFTQPSNLELKTKLAHKPIIYFYYWTVIRQKQTGNQSYEYRLFTIYYKITPLLLQIYVNIFACGLVAWLNFVCSTDLVKRRAT